MSVSCCESVQLPALRKLLDRELVPPSKPAGGCRWKAGPGIMGIGKECWLRGIRKKMDAPLLYD